MDDAIELEVNKLKGDIVRSKTLIENDKELFSDKLLNGLGSEMEGYLKNPPKENRIKKIKAVTSRRFKNLKRKLSKVIFND